MQQFFSVYEVSITSKPTYFFYWRSEDVLYSTLKCSPMFSDTVFLRKECTVYLLD